MRRLLRRPLGQQVRPYLLLLHSCNPPPGFWPWAGEETLLAISCTNGFDRRPPICGDKFFDPPALLLYPPDTLL